MVDGDHPVRRVRGPRRRRTLLVAAALAAASTALCVDGGALVEWRGDVAGVRSVLFTAAHADKRDDRSNGSDNSRRSKSTTSSATDKSTGAAATTAPTGPRGNDTSDRFGSETRSSSGAADARAALRGRELPGSVQRMMGSRSVRRDRERDHRDRFQSNQIVAIRPSTAALARATALGFGVRPGAAGRGSAIARLVLPDGLSAVMARDMLKRELPGQRFGLNHVYRSYRSATQPAGLSTPFDEASRNGRCSAERCFGPAAIRWHNALSGCARGIRIGVIDTAVDAQHPAFARQRFTMRSFKPDGASTVNATHGTGIVALLAADAKSTTPGLIPSAQFFVADVFGADPQGQPVTDTASLVEALDWMGRNKVRIVNASVAGPSDPLLEEKIRELAATGTLVVAAAGNEGPNAPPVYPAAYPEVIAVTAVDRNMKSYWRANRGSYIDIAAPGVNIWTALPGRREGFQTGTSFAVPYVTALAAALIDGSPSISKAHVLRLLSMVDLGDPGRDAVYGLGAPLAPPACGGRAVAATGWSTNIMRVLPSPASRSNFSLAGSD